MEYPYQTIPPTDDHIYSQVTEFKNILAFSIKSYAGAYGTPDLFSNKMTPNW